MLLEYPPLGKPWSNKLEFSLNFIATGLGLKYRGAYGFFKVRHALTESIKYFIWPPGVVKYFMCLACAWLPFAGVALADSAVAFTVALKYAQAGCCLLKRSQGRLKRITPSPESHCYPSPQWCQCPTPTCRPYY